MELAEVRRHWMKLQIEWSAANRKALEAEQRAATLAETAIRRGLAPSERDQAGARALRAIAERYQVDMKKFVVRHFGR